MIKIYNNNDDNNNNSNNSSNNDTGIKKEFSKYGYIYYIKVYKTEYCRVQYVLKRW